MKFRRRGNLIILALSLVLLGQILPALAQGTQSPQVLPEILEFHRKLCPVCLEAEIAIQTVKDRYPGQFAVRKVSIDEFPSLFRHYRVAIVPTQIFLDAAGKEVWRNEGVLKPEKLEQKLRQLNFIHDLPSR